MIFVPGQESGFKQILTGGLSRANRFHKKIKKVVCGMDQRDAFNRANGHGDGIKEAYGRLFKKQRDGLSTAEENEFETLKAVLSRTLDLVEICPGDVDLARQLIGRDRVHTFGTDTLENLQRYRLGGPNGNKTAYALIDPQGEQGRQVLSAIYVYWETKPVKSFGDLNGDVADILGKPCGLRSSGPTSTAFYSISGFPNAMPGAGEMLITRLHEHLTQTMPDCVLSTLSPVRTMRHWYEPLTKKAWDSGLPAHAVSDVLDDPSLKRLVLAHLLSNKNPVQIFHMGNGAIIGDIKLKANSAGSEDDADGMGIMINYVYDRDSAVLKDNRVFYRQERLLDLVSDHVKQELGVENLKLTMRTIIRSGGREMIATPSLSHRLLADQIGRLLKGPAINLSSMEKSNTIQGMSVSLA